jgi:hypothetical protein
LANSQHQRYRIFRRLNTRHWHRITDFRDLAIHIPRRRNSRSSRAQSAKSHTGHSCDARLCGFHLRLHISTSFRLGNSARHIISASWELEVDGRAKARAASSAIRCPTLAVVEPALDDLAGRGCRYRKSGIRGCASSRSHVNNGCLEKRPLGRGSDRDLRSVPDLPHKGGRKLQLGAHPPNNVLPPVFKPAENRNDCACQFSFQFR